MKCISNCCIGLELNPNLHSSLIWSTTNNCGQIQLLLQITFPMHVRKQSIVWGNCSVLNIRQKIICHMFVVQSVGSDEFCVSSLEHKKSVGYKGFVSFLTSTEKLIRLS